MQGITRRQVVASVRYQEALRDLVAEQEVAKRFVVRVKSTGALLTTPIPRITAEHFVSEQYPHSDRLELVEVL